MALNTEDLGVIYDELFDIRAKSYNLGLQLKVPVGTLDSITKQYPDHSEQLRETLKTWLKMAAQQKWQTIVEILRSRTIGELKLASDIQIKYCRGTSGEADGQVISSDTQVQIQALQEKLLELKQHIELKTQPQQVVVKLPLNQEEKESIDGEQQKQLPAIKQTADQPQPNILQQQTTLKKLIWKGCPKAPEAMHRGSVAVAGTTVYFNSDGSGRVHQYHAESQRWSLLPNLPHMGSALVMVDSKLTSVGGKQRSGKVTNSLLSLIREDRDSKWIQHFPPMGQKRWHAMAICSDFSLIVAGGSDGPNRLAAVEVMNVNTLQWFTASSLPHPFSDANASICGERLYMLSGFKHTGPTRSVFTCSISELIHSCQMLSQVGEPLSPGKNTVWRRITDSPYGSSSCATICGQLILVGGNDAGKDTSAVVTYDEKTDTWLTMEAMGTPRYKALVASLQDKAMMVVGGKIGNDRLATVEIAKVL